MKSAPANETPALRRSELCKVHSRIRVEKVNRVDPGPTLSPPPRPSGYIHPRHHRSRFREALVPDATACGRLFDFHCTRDIDFALKPVGKRHSLAHIIRSPSDTGPAPQRFRTRGTTLLENQPIELQAKAARLLYTLTDLNQTRFSFESDAVSVSSYVFLTSVRSVALPI